MNMWRRAWVLRVCENRAGLAGKKTCHIGNMARFLSRTSRPESLLRGRSAIFSQMFSAAMLLPTPVMAVDGFTFNVHGFYIINFIVFVAILVWALKKPLATFLLNRRNTLLKAIEEAEEMKRQAAQSLAQYQALLGELDREKERILAESRADAERERQRIMSESELAANKLIQEAEKRIHQERRKIEDEMRTKLIGAAMSAAETVVRERMTPQVQRRLVADSIEALESGVGQETLGRA